MTRSQKHKPVHSVTKRNLHSRAQWGAELDATWDFLRGTGPKNKSYERVRAYVIIKRREPRWGGWRLSGTCLDYPMDRKYGSGSYGWDVRRLTSSSQMLDFIMQVDSKNWATDECLAGLVRALHDILNPQATLCSGGVDKRVTEAEIRRRIRNYKQRWRRCVTGKKRTPPLANRERGFVS
jgi:hypothetical protein